MTFLRNRLFSALATVGLLGLAGQANAHIAIEDEVPGAGGGIRYYFTFHVHHTGDMTTQTGANIAGGTVGTVASKSFHDIIDPDDLTKSGGVNGPIAPGQYGWTHTSKWGLVDLGDLVGKYSSANVSVTLERFDDGDTDTADDALRPGLALWHGADQSGDDSHWYPNGIYQDNFADWWADGIKDHFLDANVGIKKASVESGWFDLNSESSLLTFVMGGNAPLSSTGLAQNFKVNVNITANPVPVPAAIYLLGSAIAGMGVIGRRRDQKTLPA